LDGEPWFADVGCANGLLCESIVARIDGAAR